MGNTSPRAGRTSSYCLRAHRAISKIQLLQKQLDGADLEFLESKIRDLEQIADNLAKKYQQRNKPDIRVEDAYTLISNLPIDIKCRVMQFLSDENALIWELILQFPTCSPYLSSVIPLPRECLYKIGADVSMISCIRDKHISLNRFWHILKHVGPELIYGCCRAQVNKVRLENLVWMLRFGVSVSNCKDVANYLIKPTLLDYSKDPLNWEEKIMENKNLLNYWCNGELSNRGKSITFKGEDEEFDLGLVKLIEQPSSSSPVISAMAASIPNDDLNLNNCIESPQPRPTGCHPPRRIPDDYQHPSSPTNAQYPPITSSYIPVAASSNPMDSNEQYPSVASAATSGNPMIANATSSNPSNARRKSSKPETYARSSSINDQNRYLNDGINGFYMASGMNASSSSATGQHLQSPGEGGPPESHHRDAQLLRQQDNRTRDHSGSSESSSNDYLQLPFTGVGYQLETQTGEERHRKEANAKKRLTEENLFI